MTVASTATVTHQANETAKEIKNFFHQIKIEKLQLLHEQESLGSRNEQIEQEQEQQELTESETDCDFLIDSDSFIDTSKDMFASQSPADNEIINSVLQDLDAEDEDTP